MQTIERNLQYSFKNPHLLTLALTHRSADKQNNQRLEYLGDAVLDCIIAETLYKQHPQEQEGTLSQYRSSLVNKAHLATIAKKLKIPPYLILGPGEKSQKTITCSILADTLEAIIGAIYLDTDFMTCKSCVLLWFSKELNRLQKNQSTCKDNKSILQEWCQARNLPTPQYKIINITGKEHNQIFQAQCVIVELNQTSCGKGASRRAAEQIAAQHMLKTIQNNNMDNQ